MPPPLRPRGVHAVGPKPSLAVTEGPPRRAVPPGALSTAASMTPPGAPPPRAPGVVSAPATVQPADEAPETVPVPHAPMRPPGSGSSETPSLHELVKREENRSKRDRKKAAGKSTAGRMKRKERLRKAMAETKQHFARSGHGGEAPEKGKLHPTVLGEPEPAPTPAHVASAGAFRRPLRTDA